MDLLGWLTHLIGFDTTSRNSNLPLITFLANALDKANIPVTLIHDAKEPKANLLATLPGRKGQLTGGLILSGHTDVVPVDGQIWDTDPFVATIKNDRLYGRGACDMKGFIAAIMSLLPKFQELQLDYPLHFAFSYDEEIGCRGALGLIEELKKNHYKPNACIVGEPTSMLPVIGHKGIQVFRCTIQGVAAHSSLTPQGCNAIEHAASLVNYLRGLANQFKQEGKRDKAYDVPYTTLSTNLIQGGNAANTIPSSCELLFEFRNLPGDHPDALQQKIKDYLDRKLLPLLHEEQPGTGVILEILAQAPGLEIAPDEKIVRTVRQLCNFEGELKVAYATEAGLFHQAQIPTLVCGPGNIEQAHRANEFVSLEQLYRCQQFLIDLVRFFKDTPAF